MQRFPFAVPAAVILFFLLIGSFRGCGGGGDPLVEIRAAYAATPTYSVVLDDMKEEGNFFKTYFHKFQIVTPEQTTETDWKEVSKDLFEYSLPFLGMTVFTKQDGKEVETVGPPGYEYVGNTRYGEWRTDSSGQSFWAWYGQYALISHLLGPSPIYRNDWDAYRGHTSQQRPYYGPNQGYGTNGSVTRAKKPDFFARQQSAELSRKASFANRVDQRIGRTRFSSRARSGGVGK